jgi:hypothetical protein
MKIEYRSDFDKELWVVSRGDWQIPIYCDHCSGGGRDYMHVRPAVPIGFRETSELAGVLASVGARPLRVGWLVAVSGKLDTVASRAPGVTPEFYYKWGGKKTSSVPSKAPIDAPEPVKQSSENSSKFLNHVSEVTGVPVGTLTLCWAAICQAAPGWMMSGEVVTMGFCRLAALPYRRNWKEIVLNRFPGFKRTLLIDSPKRFMQLAFTGAARVVRSTELTSCKNKRGRQVFGWTIEVIHDEPWEDICSRTEQDEACRVGPSGYIKRWASKVSRCEELIYEILAEACKKEHATTCRVLWRRGSRSVRFVQGSPTIVGTCPVIECDEGGSQSVDDFLGIEDNAKYLEEAAGRLLEVSDLQQENADVRDSR